MDFEDRVLRFMQQWEYKPTEFGRRAISDPNFVRLLLSGKRSPGLRVMRRVEAWMALGPEVHDIKIRRKPPRRGYPWTQPLDNQLKSLIAVWRNDWPIIGAHLGVSRHTARRRALKLGLWKPMPVSWTPSPISPPKPKAPRPGRPVKFNQAREDKREQARALAARGVTFTEIGKRLKLSQVDVRKLVIPPA